MVKNLPANARDVGLIPGWGFLLEEEMATHSSILAWKIPRTKEATVHGVAKSWVLSLHDSQQGALQPSPLGLLCLLAGRLGFTVALVEWDPRGELALLTIPGPNRFVSGVLHLRVARPFYFRQVIARIHEKDKAGPTGTGGSDFSFEVFDTCVH